MQPVSSYSMPSYTQNVVQPSPHGTSGFAPGPTAFAVPLNTTGVAMVDRYQHKRSVKLGVIQIFIGLACIIFNAVSIGYQDKTGVSGVAFVGHGFWIGLTFISAGGLGIAAGKNRTKCTIIGFMIMSIISAALTTIMFSLGIVGALYSSFEGERRCSNSYSYSYSPSHPYYRYACDEYRVVVAMEACLAIAGIIEAIAAIWGAVICCQSGICCSSGPQQAVVLPVSYYPNSGQVMLITHPHGVQMIYPQPQVAVPFQQGLMMPPVNYQAGFTPPPPWNNESGLPGSTPQGQIYSPPPYEANSQLFQGPPEQQGKN